MGDIGGVMMTNTGRVKSRYGYREYEYVYGREARMMRIRQMRRRKALKRRICRIALVLAAAFLLWIALTGFSGMTVTKAPVYKYYTAVTVRCNDTLWDIAQKHITEEYSTVKAYMKDIMKVNDMKTDAVYYGQKLILPYYSTEVK